MHWRWPATGLRRTAGHTVAPARNYATNTLPVFSQQQKDEARHLLRAILREATYFPDQQARTYISRYAVDRFKDYKIGHKDGQILTERRDALVEKAKLQLRHMIRANAGELKPFQRVMLLTYGRSGRRRRELLKPLVEIPDEAPGGVLDETDQLAGQHADGQMPAVKKVKPIPTLNKKLMALLRTSLSAHMSSSTRVKIKSSRQLDPRIPERNSWSKPMPESRVSNLTQKWYATMLDQVLPPIPDHEYERLKLLALGIVRPPPPPAARSPANGSSPRSETERSALIANRKIFDKVRGHTFTRRFLQRQYADVFTQVPRMKWDNDSENWTVEWGRASLRAQIIENLTEPSKTSATSE
ncbi:hypothetical protein MBLNU457_g0546t1 [Dothideomycetes sp. NU457]